VVSLVGSNVAAFAQECLVLDAETTVAAGDVRSTYEAWSRARGEKPLSLRAFGTQLNVVVPEKWNTEGIIKYRGVRLTKRTMQAA
jgi:phage/plasmid-associated DNA primase